MATGNLNLPEKWKLEVIVNPRNKTLSELT